MDCFGARVFYFTISIFRLNDQSLRISIHLFCVYFAGATYTRVSETLTRRDNLREWSLKKKKKLYSSDVNFKKVARTSEFPWVIILRSSYSCGDSQSTATRVSRHSSCLNANSRWLVYYSHFYPVGIPEVAFSDPIVIKVTAWTYIS